MTVSPLRDWSKDFWGKLYLALATKAATFVLITIGAALVSGAAALADDWFFGAHMPIHARVFMPAFSSIVGVAIMLAATLFFRERTSFFRTGLRRVFPVRYHSKTAQAVSTRHLEHGIAQIKRIMQSTPGAGERRLLLVSGYYYLGAPSLPGSEGPLQETLTAPDRVKVLLLNPYKEVCSPRWWAGQRASEAMADRQRKLTPEEYTKRIQAVCEHLVHRRDTENIDLEIGFYNFWPTWQLFLADGEGIVQPVASGVHAQYNPMYFLQYTECSLLVPFTRYFNVIWQRWTAHRDEHREFYEERRIISSSERKA